ncbi:MAG: hypothetical protein JST14_05300 [Bacteroidetes bacterium]|nr:hypothetical protein [Bacteroidota bacterium]MBS1978410.1 hypothetical protein [Bacteroidota bacterium]
MLTRKTCRVFIYLATAFYLFYAIADDAIVSLDSHWSNYCLTDSISSEFQDDPVHLVSVVVKHTCERMVLNLPEVRSVSGAHLVLNKNNLLQRTEKRMYSSDQDLPSLHCIFRI